jgi:hypothetical protein
MHMMTLI